MYGKQQMSSCSLLAQPTLCDSYLAGVSVCVFTAAGHCRVCPYWTTGEHVSSSSGRAFHHTSSFTS